MGKRSGGSEKNNAAVRCSGFRRENAADRTDLYPGAGCFDLKRVVLWGRMLSAGPCKACDGNDPESGASGAADHGGGVVLVGGYDMERRRDRT